MDERERIEIWERDEGTCQVCHKAPGQEIDHIIAKKMGGRHGEAKKRIEAKENKRLICRDCHRRRHG